MHHFTIFCCRYNDKGQKSKFPKVFKMITYCAPSGRCTPSHSSLPCSTILPSIAPWISPRKQVKMSCLSSFCSTLSTPDNFSPYLAVYWMNPNGSAPDDQPREEPLLFPDSAGKPQESSCGACKALSSAPELLHRCSICNSAGKLHNYSEKVPSGCSFLCKCNLS